MTTECVAVTNDWLNTETTAPLGAGSTGNIGTLACYPYQHEWITYPWIQPIVQTVTTTARPIRLTFREVEIVREAAQRDSRLKAILQKFTPLIEVEMSLEP